jgi:hypothetical protein
VVICEYRGKRSVRLIAGDKIPFFHPQSSTNAPQLSQEIFTSQNQELCPRNRAAASALTNEQNISVGGFVVASLF